MRRTSGENSGVPFDDPVSYGELRDKFSLLIHVNYGMFPDFLKKRKRFNSIVIIVFFFFE